MLDQQSFHCVSVRLSEFVYRPLQHLQRERPSVYAGREVDLARHPFSRMPCQRERVCIGDTQLCELRDATMSERVEHLALAALF